MPALVLHRMPMTAAATAHATSTVESEVARIRALLKERRFAEGVAAATALLAKSRKTATCSICSRSANASSSGPRMRWRRSSSSSGSIPASAASTRSAAIATWR